MRTLLVLILAFTLSQLPFGGSPPEKLEEKPPVKGWWMVSSFATPPTRYSTAGRGVIKAESLGTRSSLYKKVGEKEKDLPILAWRWKVSNVVRSAIETKKDRFDAAARVMVIFGEDKGFWGLDGREPAGLKIEYVWASHLPIGRVFEHPGEKSCKVVVLESGDGKAEQWVYEKRNIRKDFKTAFAADPPEALAIGIQTDTRYSNEMVTAYYSDPLLTKK